MAKWSFMSGGIKRVSFKLTRDDPSSFFKIGTKRAFWHRTIDGSYNLL